LRFDCGSETTTGMLSATRWLRRRPSLELLLNVMLMA
jgi:hypothetical protein